MRSVAHVRATCTLRRGNDEAASVVNYPDRIARSSFAIADGFERSLVELEVLHDAIECDFDRRSRTEFTAEVFLRGKSVCRCRVWQGGLHSGDGISYAEGRLSGNAVNEMLTMRSKRLQSSSGC